MRRISWVMSFLLTGLFSTVVAIAADEAVPPAASAAAAPAPGREAQIPFADKTLWNWQVVDERTVLIQDRGRRWYKATLLGPCVNLQFAQRLGFESNSDGTFDKFSAIQVGEQRCPLVSLVKTTAPPKKLKAKNPDPAAAH